MSQKSERKLLSWAELRFSIIGALLAIGPEQDTLEEEFAKLASRSYRHPIKGTEIRFSVSTIERWYYRALGAEDPLKVLGRKRRGDQGQTRVITPALMAALGQQYRAYPHWSYQLHHDNLVALVEEQPELGKAPSYSTVRRTMQEQGWTKKKKIGTQRAGQVQAAQRLQQREVRSYEVDYVHALWHLDFHQGSVRVTGERGEWQTPLALCVLDDRSRLCCHLQWYLNENAACLIHGLSQAFYKRGLPRALMTDNGAAMVAEETRNGLLGLGIHQERTLAYSPYQNGKQEAFWGQLEGRFLAMLSRVKGLSLDELNRATQAWVEQEYNRREHEEIHTTPLKRLVEETSVSREAPDPHRMRYFFTRKATRRQRLSDGTLTLEGTRFEVPSRFRHFKQLGVRYQSWDLSSAYLSDSQTQDLLAVIYPLDKAKQAQGLRRLLTPAQPSQDFEEPDFHPHPPLLRKYLADYAACGAPAGFVPNESPVEVDHEES